MLRDEHDELARAGLRVVGVSPDDQPTHARFKAEHALPFELLSDPDKAAIEGYGVNGPLGIGVRRVSPGFLPGSGSSASWWHSRRSPGGSGFWAIGHPRIFSRRTISRS